MSNPAEIARVEVEGGPGGTTSTLFTYNFIVPVAPADVSFLSSVART